MNNIYKSLLDFTILSFIPTNEFWEEIILAFIIIIMNCLIIPLIKKRIQTFTDRKVCIPYLQELQYIMQDAQFKLLKLHNIIEL